MEIKVPKNDREEKHLLPYVPGAPIFMAEMSYVKKHKIPYFNICYIFI